MPNKRELIKSLTDRHSNNLNRPKKGSLAKKVALGAGGLALASGVVATGAALADVNIRKNLGKGVSNMLNMIGDQAQTSYNAVAQQVGRGRKGKKASGRGR